jgi:hypothetical protein
LKPSRGRGPETLASGSTAAPNTDRLRGGDLRMVAKKKVAKKKKAAKKPAAAL